MTAADDLFELFKGNPDASCTLKNGEYVTLSSGLTPTDIERHISGTVPSALSIPIRPAPDGAFVCSFAAADCDRHLEDDPPIDYVAVAQRITELGLPLVLTRSKSPKSAHLWLFFSEENGFDCGTARRLIQKYVQVLGITGEVEIFPKQERLKKDDEGEMQRGSGINLPHFGRTRIAFGASGEELTLEQFVSLARSRQSYGVVLAQRDLVDGPSGRRAVSDGDEHPMLAATARRIHADNLTALHAAAGVERGDGWNKKLNDSAFFAGRMFACKTLELTEAELKAAIRKAAAATAENEREMESTLDSGWEAGILKPLQILEDLYTEATATLKAFNEKYYVVKDFGGKTRICWETIDKTTGSLFVSNQSFHDFYNSYMNQIIQTGETEKSTGRGGKKETHREPEFQTKADYWLKHPERRTYQQIVYAPGETLGPEFRNLWGGFAVPPVKGNCGLYLAHLQDNVCKGDAAKFDWLTRNMAWKIRNPGEKGYTAPVFKGAEGVGKNMASDPFAFLFGAHALTVTRKEHLAGHFNNHLRACSLVIANEAFFAGDRQHEASLKGLITDEYFMIEAKGVDAVPARNRMSIIIMSNEAWVVPAGPEARRFAVFDCGDAQKENTEYFGALQMQLSGGRSGNLAGYKALLHYLMFEVQVRDFDPRKAIRTEALAQQQSLSLRGVEALWFEILYRGELPDGNPVSSERLLKWAERQHNKKWEGICAEQLGLFLGNNPKGVFHGMGFGKTRKGGGNKWIIPTLRDARKLWDDRRFKVDWPVMDPVQGELGGGEASGWDLVKVGDEPLAR